MENTLYEVIILVLAIMLCYAIYKYNIKNKHLTITVLDQEQIKKRLEQEVVRLEECIKIKNKAMQESAQTHHNIVEQKEKQNGTLKKRCIELESTMNSTVKEAVAKARKDSIKRQRSILKGQATEQLAPYINPNYNPKDYKFMGDPIDYIIFDGMSDLNEKEDIVNKIIFMDIKTGTSRLNKVQKKIKEAIDDGRIEFQLYRPEQDIKEEEEK